LRLGCLEFSAGLPWERKPGSCRNRRGLPLQNIGPFLMTPELGGSKRAEGDDGTPGGARLLHGMGDEAQARALAAERLRNSGMVDDDLVRADAGEGHLRFRPVRVTQHIAALAPAKVFHLDFRQLVAHAFVPSIADAVSKARAAAISLGRTSWPPSCQSTVTCASAAR